MRWNNCRHTDEIGELLRSGRWPLAPPAELEAHAKSCRRCGDEILLTAAFQGARAVSTSAAVLLPPGIVWWRAQLRQRNEAVAIINRPLLGAQLFALAVCVLAGAALLVTQAGHGQQWMAWMTSLPQAQAFQMDHLFAWPALKVGMNVLIPGLGLLGCMGGVLVFLVMDRG